MAGLAGGLRLADRRLGQCAHVDGRDKRDKQFRIRSPVRVISIPGQQLHFWIEVIDDCASKVSCFEWVSIRPDTYWEIAHRWPRRPSNEPFRIAAEMTISSPQARHPGFCGSAGAGRPVPWASPLVKQKKKNQWERFASTGWHYNLCASYAVRFHSHRVNNEIKKRNSKHLTRLKYY